ncbi:MAG: dTDP-4-dehydrorhamnose reductase [Gemmatimonadota bacterium]
MEVTVPRLLLTGVTGQVGSALAVALPALGTVIPVDRRGCELTDAAAITRLLDATQPTHIIHPAAYTSVDRAESERAIAEAVNVGAVRALAAWAAAHRVPMVLYSTDYVFDGQKVGWYTEDDATGPINVYGRTKRDAEVVLREATPHHLILRTSWVISSRGTNFVRTMLRLARERDRVRVVDDQIGAPTDAALVASVTRTVLQRLLKAGAASFPWGTYHVAAAGETSWCGAARYLLEEAQRLGVAPSVAAAVVDATPTAAYPTPARRPLNSRLDTTKLRTSFGLTLPDWRTGVTHVVTSLEP